MFARLVFLLIALFWVTMNVLLWRAEYGAGDQAGSVVPVGVVWRKILTAPDTRDELRRLSGASGRSKTFF